MVKRNNATGNEIIVGVTSLQKDTFKYQITSFHPAYKEYCVSVIPCPISCSSYITKPRLCKLPRPLAIIFRPYFLYIAWSNDLHMCHKKTLAHSMAFKIKAVLVLPVLCDWDFCQ